jgi:hypothetical protein
MPSPFRTAIYAAVFPTGGKLSTELYIGGGDAVANESLYHWLLERREDVEAKFGELLSWQELPGRQACRIAAYGVGDVTRTDEYDHYIDWFFDTGDRLRQAFDGLAEEYAHLSGQHEG